MGHLSLTTTKVIADTSSPTVIAMCINCQDITQRVVQNTAGQKNRPTPTRPPLSLRHVRCGRRSRQRNILLFRVACDLSQGQRRKDRTTWMYTRYSVRWHHAPIVSESWLFNSHHEKSPRCSRRVWKGLCHCNTLFPALGDHHCGICRWAHGHFLFDRSLSECRSSCPRDELLERFVSGIGRCSSVALLSWCSAIARFTTCVTVF